jgi:hypothetical protein
MYIKTTDNLPGDTFNDDGTVTLPFLHFHIQDDIYFVADGSDLTGINYTDDAGDYQHTLNDRCKDILKVTDWYDIRKAGTGQEPPSNITSLRNSVRLLIQENN